MPAPDDDLNPPLPPDTERVLFDSPHRSELEPHLSAEHQPYHCVDRDTDPAPLETWDPLLAPAEPGAARDVSWEGTSSPARPAYVLYSPGCVAWAAFWGGFLGGALVLARNYWVLRRRGAAVAVVLTFAALTLTASVALPGLRWFMALPAVVCSWLGASLLQGRLYRQHQRACGRSGSGSAAFGIGLLGSVVYVGLPAGLFDSAAFQTPLNGTRLRVGHNDAIYYSRGATRAEAERLGKFLKSEGVFDETTRQDVLLSSSDQALLVSFFVDSGTGTDAATVRSFDLTAALLSGDVFDGRPVQVLLRLAGPHPAPVATPVRSVAARLEEAR